MANIQQRLPEKRAGDFFVDETCIDCDTCSNWRRQSFAIMANSAASIASPKTKGIRASP